MRALKRFVENEGQAREVDGSIATLPLSGNLPDLHADTTFSHEHGVIVSRQRPTGNTHISLLKHMVGFFIIFCLIGYY